MMKKSKVKNLQSKISFWHPASLVCTVFGVGKIPFAPGTWGSLVGLIFYIFYGEWVVFALVPFFFIGAAAANHYGQKSGKDDASEIVVDEVVGMWVTILIFGVLTESIEYLGLLIAIILPVLFVTFRFFDIVKPFPIGWCDRNIKGGFGVMFDDVVAGIFAGITSALIFWLIELI
jgi:phosphatidylglycerophosphatase A